MTRPRRLLRPVPLRAAQRPLDGIADFNGLPFGEEHEAAPAKASQHSLSDIRAGRVHRNSPRKTFPAERPIFGRFFAIVRAALASLRIGLVS